MSLGADLTVITVEHSGRCTCGEPLPRGERAGRLASSGELLCLWCVADLTAGRERTSHRQSPVLPPLPSPLRSTPPAVIRPRRSGPSALSSALIALMVIAAIGIGVVAGPSAWRSRSGAAEAAGSSTAYAFSQTIEGTTMPVRFEACRPIKIVVNSEQAPPQASSMLTDALDRVSEATGLEFEVEGETTEVPSTDRGARDLARYGPRWSPVLVAWTDPQTVPELEGDVAGVGGPRSGDAALGQQSWVSGIVYLDGPAMSGVLANNRDGYRQARAIVMHELAHLVGLTHVDDQSQLMAPRNSTQVGFAAGDREGLRQLGGGPCTS